jgi:hypothetical protein
MSYIAVAALVFGCTFLGALLGKNPTVVAALFLGAISVAVAIFLILELNRPYGGVMQISIAPIRNALTQMNR